MYWESWGIDRMAGPPNSRKRIDMSLRLWSDSVPLGPLMDELSIVTRYLHVIDQPMAKKGPLAQRLAAPLCVDDKRYGLWGCKRFQVVPIYDRENCFPETSG